MTAKLTVFSYLDNLNTVNSPQTEQNQPMSKNQRLHSVLQDTVWIKFRYRHLEPKVYLLSYSKMQKKLKWVFALLVLLCLTTLTAVILSSFQWIKLKRTQKTLSQAEQTIIKLSPPAAHTPTQPSASETDLAIAWIQNLITPSSPSQSQISPQPLLKKDQLPYTVLPWKKVTSGSTTQLVSALQITHSVTDPVQGRFVVLVKTQQSLEVYPASALSFIKNIKIDPLQAEDFSVSKFREIKFNLSLNPVSATKNNTEIDTLIFSKEHQLIAIDHQKI